MSDVPLKGYPVPIGKGYSKDLHNRTEIGAYAYTKEQRMEAIKRYDCEIMHDPFEEDYEPYVSMKEYPKGAWVSYEDHMTYCKLVTEGLLEIRDEIASLKRTLRGPDCIR